MNIVAITKHNDLVERLRTAFEGAGHHIQTIPDPLQALALEAWKDAHMILVDAEGDPLDGIRFSTLLRGESRHLFRNLPIFLIFDNPVAEMEPGILMDADVDGFLLAHDGMQRILTVLNPAIEGNLIRRDIPRISILATGFSKALRERISRLVEHFGFELVACPAKDLVARQKELRTPILLLGLDPTGVRTLGILQQMREHAFAPYVVLIGRFPDEGVQRKLILAGVRDWLPLPLSHPLLLHALRRGMEWLHLKRIHHEFQSQLSDMRERRLLLEMETSSLRNEVLTDPLTELLNRRAFNQNLELAINQWVRHHRPFVLIFGDIDYFKLINDRFGHLVGDEVLKVIAERIRSSLRRSDLAFRIGGEEFAIILMETGLQAGAEVADKLRRKIDENPIHLETGQSIFPTVSFGVGMPADHDANALCTVVDEALYIAKHKGRNRIEVVAEKRAKEGSSD
jgi:diguanylate cyclase (GGDEF)-like protein